jgi:hypothetical protein
MDWRYWYGLTTRVRRGLNCTDDSDDAQTFYRAIWGLARMEFVLWPKYVKGGLGETTTDTVLIRVLDA